jgi:arginine utilization protein RocB
MKPWFAHVRALTLDLVRAPSVTDTPGESAFAQRLYALLAALPYFRAHPEQLWLERTSDDLRERYNLFALVRGSDPRTIVLSGHYDVVAVENYGQLAPWAFDPEALLPRLIDELRASGDSPADQQALRDLESGDYLPGRGALDMKSGLAIGIAVLSRFAEQAARRGNLLLIATPDEENASHGMRSAALRLPGLASGRRLELAAAINLDSGVDRGDGDEGQAIFFGTVGKLLPSVYLVGRDTHAGAPFDGINASLLAAETTRRIECNASLADSAAGAVAPPPVCLKQTDLKTHYDVTTPSAVWCYYNLLTHQRTAAEALQLIVAAVREALDSALSYLHDQTRRYAALSGVIIELPPDQPLTLTFAELRQRALDRGGPAAEQALRSLTQQLAADSALDLPTLSLRLTELLWSWSGLSGPAAVVGFAGLYYPPAHVAGNGPRQARLRETALAEAAALSRETGCAIHSAPFFPGISDMSFLGSAASSAEIAAVAANSPAWDARLRFDYGSVRALDLPTINIGPAGRDYHQRTERVRMSYSFEVAPELIWRIVERLLEA